MSNSTENQSNTSEKVVRKHGKTLILKGNKDFDLSTLPFGEYEGLQERNESRSACVFLVFDTVENAAKVWKHLKENHSDDVLSKFAHYKLFFKISNLEDSSDYNDVKERLSTWINQNTGANVLYFKLYRKNNQYLGCGDLTLDTKEGMDALLDKDKFKEFSVDDTEYTGTFYRFDNRRRKTNPTQQQHHHHHKTASMNV